MHRKMDSISGGSHQFKQDVLEQCNKDKGFLMHEISKLNNKIMQLNADVLGTDQELKHVNK